MALKILPFKDEYAKAFYELNIEWLETYFYVEDFDKEVLSNPKKYIINPGGYLFLVAENNTIIGTVALMPYSERVFELTKMAVAPKHQGNKIGQHLMKYCIEFAEENNFDKLILYSNTILRNAIHIYKKHGFTEVPVEENSPYKRSNIKMELVLNE
jgi:N-acetylglutamate synthase-like GNAT family acetyltransferase